MLLGRPRERCPAGFRDRGSDSLEPISASTMQHFTLEPVANPTVEGRLQNQMNVIKLHGFFNWRSADGAHVMIVGTDKTKTIASMPAELVREYLQRSHQCRRRGVGGRGLWLWG